jgi:Domain of unknown function (DUF3854)/Origin of replication binding protein
MTSSLLHHSQPLSQQASQASLITAKHWQDWRSSCVDPDLITANVRSLEGNDPHSYLLYAPGLARTRTGRLSAGLLWRYQHLSDGGWWCNGVDPLNDWNPMLWGCFKPDRPYLDPKKQKPIKYEHPKGVNRGTFFLNLPWHLAQKIAQTTDTWGDQTFDRLCPLPSTAIAGDSWENDIPLPENPETAIAPRFWQWVTENPEVPVILTEGAKKAGCLLSHGYAAIGLPGIHGGYSTLTTRFSEKTTRQLVPALNCIATPGRTIYLCFDQDSKPTTLRNVQIALQNLGALLKERGVKVHVLAWTGNAKGIDDLVAQDGTAALHQAIQTAESLETWRWQVQQSRHLTLTPTLKLHVPELSIAQITDTKTVNLDPAGTIVLASGKGTGKTNLIAQLLQNEAKVISIGHRIALQRNTCHRWQLDFKNDLDRIHGRFCTTNGYTKRIGLCIDSILSIQPDDVIDGILVIDEFMQVLRHLILGETCAQQGKRGALIEHFNHLLAIARQVIIADADANDIGINYIHQWRNDRSLCLIHNDYITPSFDATFLDTKQVNDVYIQLIEDLKANQKIFIATDSRSGSKKLLAKIQQECPNLTGLLINSETSGEPEQQAFITNPNANVHRYDWVMGTPSLGTGVSIEVDHFDRVYGIFRGVLTDGDAAQALNRVRAKVPRIIWAAEKGGDPTRLHSSTNPRVIQRAIRQRSSANANLLRAQLGYKLFPMEREDDLHRSDPSIDLYCDLLAQDNASHAAFNAGLKARLHQEGSTITTIVPAEHTAEFASAMRDISKLISQNDAIAIANARILSETEVENLKYQDSLTKADQDAMEKRKVQAFFCKADITPDDVQFHGKYSSQLRQLEALLYGCETSIRRDRTELDTQLQWGSKLTPWDLTGHELKRAIRDRLGLREYLDPNLTWTAESTQAIADLVRTHAKDIKTYLNLTIPETVSNNWILSHLLQQLGLKTKASYRGKRGEQITMYSLDPEHLDHVTQILIDRQKYRLDQEKEAQQEPPDPGIESVLKPRCLDPLDPCPYQEEDSAKSIDLISLLPNEYQFNQESDGEVQSREHRLEKVTGVKKENSAFLDWLSVQDERIQHFLVGSLKFM